MSVDFNGIESAIGLARKVVQVVGMAETIYERVRKARKAPPAPRKRR